MKTNSVGTATRGRRRGLRAALVPAAVGAAALAIGAEAATAIPIPDLPQPRYETRELAYTGANQDVTVPSWATKSWVTLAGGAGGSTCVLGGQGALFHGSLNVSGGQVLTVGVGGRGGSYTSGGGEKYALAGGWGGSGATGGTAYAAFTISRVASGGGGTALSRGDAELIIAGGGGGAGQCDDGDGGVGGTRGDGARGSDYLAANGGAGGGHGAAGGHAGGEATNAGSGGGGYRGGGGGEDGDNHFFVQAGAGGGGAGTNWRAPGVGSLNGDGSAGSGPDGNGYARIVFEGYPD